MKFIENHYKNYIISCFVFQVLWRPYSWYQKKNPLFLQWFLRCTTHPVFVCHSFHLPGNSNQCHHVWRIAGRCHREHAGEDTVANHEFTNATCSLCLWVFLNKNQSSLGRDYSVIQSRSIFNWHKLGAASSLTSFWNVTSSSKVMLVS